MQESHQSLRGAETNENARKQAGEKKAAAEARQKVLDAEQRERDIQAEKEAAQAKLDTAREEEYDQRKKVARYNRQNYLKGRSYIQLVIEDEQRRIKKTRAKILAERKEEQIKKQKRDRIRAHQELTYGKSNIENEVKGVDESFNPIVDVPRKIEFTQLFKVPPRKKDVANLIRRRDRRIERDKREKEEKKRKEKDEEERKSRASRRRSVTFNQ